MYGLEQEPRLHLGPAAQGTIELTGPAAQSYMEAISRVEGDRRYFLSSVDPRPTINIVLGGVIHTNWRVNTVSDGRLMTSIGFDFAVPSLVGVAANV